MSFYSRVRSIVNTLAIIHKTDVIFNYLILCNAKLESYEIGFAQKKTA